MRTKSIIFSLLIISIFNSQNRIDNLEFKPNTEIVNYDGFYIDGGQNPTTELKNFLNILADFLKKNENLKLVIERHTDYRGINEFNLNYSQRLADKAKEYLIYLGIDENRINSIGKGEEEPIEVIREINFEYDFLPIGQKLNKEFIETLNNNFEREKANDLNRRTVFRIIESELCTTQAKRNAVNR